MIGDQAIEFDVGIHLAAIASIEVLRVDFVDLDDQLVDVLDEQVELDWILVAEDLRIGGCKVEINAVFQLLVLGGRKQRVPLLGISQPLRDFGFGENLLQVLVANVGRVPIEGTF